MIAVITGDIIGSRTQRNSNEWLASLKKVLQTIGTQPNDWEIFQGDSFQLQLPPEKSLFYAFYIKAAMRSLPNLDVRLAIGLGAKTFVSNTITEANGSAFIYSGDTLKKLKSIKQNLAIKSDFADFDAIFNLMFRLALLTMDNWTTGAATIMVETLQHPELNQKELGKKLGIKQPSVSQRQKTAHLNELMALNSFYQQKLTELPTS